MRRQRRLATPLIDVELFRIPAFSGAIAANGLSIFAFLGMLYFFSQYLQLVRGFSPFVAGLAEMPATLASLVVVVVVVGGGSSVGPDRDHWSTGTQQHQGAGDYEPRIARPLSPTSAAIARATGQYSDGAAGGGGYPQSSGGGSMNGSSGSESVNNGWGYQQYPGHANYNFGYQQPFVQPHINPRFASQFGMNLAYAQQMQYAGYGQYGMGYTAGGNMPAGDWGDWSSQQSSATQNAAPDGQPPNESS